jgi:microcompartment protein CcmK/EutM
MIFGKVTGTVVCSRRDDGFDGARYLLIDKTDHHGKRRGDYVVALDMLGAGYDELVLVSEGSPARETPQTVNRPFDALVVGIVDLVDEMDTITYRK